MTATAATKTSPTKTSRSDAAQLRAEYRAVLREAHNISDAWIEAGRPEDQRPKITLQWDRVHRLFMTMCRENVPFYTSEELIRPLPDKEEQIARERDEQDFGWMPAHRNQLEEDKRRAHGG